MFVKRLFLRDFRNYGRADLCLDPSLNLFFGHNGSGKTNLLEAMYLLAVGSSHRTPRLAEMIRWGEGQFHVKLLAQGAEREESLELVYRRDGRKAARRNGIPLKRLRDLLGRFMVVLFSPDDLRLVKGGPHHRREWLDGVLRQIRPAYGAWVAEFQRALGQRNEALRGSDPSLVAVWEETLARTGSRITVLRRRLLQAVKGEAGSVYARLDRESRRLDVTYLSGIGGGNETNERKDLSKAVGGAEADLYAQYRQLLRAGRGEDRNRGFTLRGPHRDEVELFLAGRPVRQYGSQGQQRSAVLALKLAELTYLEETTGGQPVLLLDDVLSELDEDRSAALMAEVTARYRAVGGQVLVTAATEPHPQDAWREAARFQVTDGQIARQRVE